MKMTKTAGVYKITNTVSGVFYIGSTSCLSTRLSHHRRDLRLGKHDNPYMQRSWDKYGAEVFTFDPILVCRREDTLMYEQIFLDKFAGDRSRCFNIYRNAINPSLGYKWRPESRAKLSATISGVPKSDAWRESARENRRGKLKTETHRSGIANGRRGKSHDAKVRESISEATRAKMGKGPVSIQKKPILCSNGMTFDSAYSAVEWLKENGWPRANKSGVAACCKGRSYTCYGLKWAYLNEQEDNQCQQ